MTAVVFCTYPDPVMKFSVSNQWKTIRQRHWKCRAKW